MHSWTKCLLYKEKKIEAGKEDGDRQDHTPLSWNNKKWINLKCDTDETSIIALFCMTRQMILWEIYLVMITVSEYDKNCPMGLASEGNLCKSKIET